MPSDPPTSREPLVPLHQGVVVPVNEIDSTTASLLPPLAMEEHIPSVRPWLRIATTAVIVSAGVGVAFMAVCPYRVVVRGDGAVRPAGEQVLINAPFEGRVVSIDVRTNQTVEVNQPIVTLDPSRLRGEVDEAGKSRGALDEQMRALQGQARADYSRALLEVEKSRSSLAFAQAEYDRYRQLISQGAASASFLEEKLSTLAQARASLEQAKEALQAVRAEGRNREAQLRRELAGIERSSEEGLRNLSRAVVRSPVKGVVFQLQVQNPQQTIGAGQALATIMPSTAARVVKVNVRSEDVGNVKPGQRAELRVSSCPYPDYGTLSAEVLSVSPDALPQTGSLDGTEGARASSDLYEVVLRPRSNWLGASPQRCEVKVGMRVQADITTRQETLLRFFLRKTRIFVGA